MIENLAQYKKSCSSTWWGIIKEICRSSESLSKMTSQIKYKNWYNIGSAITHKNFWDSLYCHEKVLKNVRLAQRYPQFPLPPGSMFCQVWRSYARQWWPGMNKQSCNQHWIKGQGDQVSLLLWLIAGLTLNCGFFKKSHIFDVVSLNKMKFHEIRCCSRSVVPL